MEHRCGVRRDLDLTVLVRRRGWAGSVVAQIRNISITGCFIQGPPAAFPLYALVRLEAAQPGDAGARWMACNAMVARVATNGVGLLFDQVRPAGLLSLFTAATTSPTGNHVQAAQAGCLAVRPT